MERIGRVTFLLVLGAWALPAAAQQTSNDIQTKLETQRAANPGSVAANRALGIWYYEAGRFAEARPPLEQARHLDPRDGVSAVYAGLAAEAVKDYTAAKEAYNVYLAVGKTKRVRNDVRVHLVTVTKEEARAAAKDAVAREAQVAQMTGSPTTVAVLPFTIGSADPNLQPLQVGLEDLVISDLAKPKKLTVVERDHIQAIADEIALSTRGDVDSATAVRAGKLIPAGRIVQGSLISTGATNITMTSTVLNTEDAQTVGQGMQQNGVLDNLFSLEKALVFATFRDLGISLTPAEMQDIDRRPTQSLQAFLAYSSGLMAEDQGRLEEAARFFEDAHSIDPGFSAAEPHAQSAAAQSQVTTARIEAHLHNSSEGKKVAAAERGTSPVTLNAALGATLGAVVGDVNPTTTNKVAPTNNTTGAAPSCHSCSNSGTAAQPAASSRAHGRAPISSAPAVPHARAAPALSRP
jgi:tetratricopeptide (TPR) repeat protein